MEVTTVLAKLDKLLVDMGKYSSKEELMMDALRALLRAKPELRMDLAIELYKRNEASLARAAEFCGLNIEDFKELLKERGIKITVADVTSEELDREVELILSL